MGQLVMGQLLAGAILAAAHAGIERVLAGWQASAI